MGEESTEEAPKEEAPKEEAPKEEAPKEETPKKTKAPKEKKPKVKKERPPRDGPIISFTGPKGSPKIVALMASLSTILTGNTLFWLGVNNVATRPLVGGLIFIGVVLFILGIILILTIDILDFGDPTLKKIEWFEKFYRFEILLIIGGIIILLEALSIYPSGLLIPQPRFSLQGILSGILVITAAILENMRKNEKEMKPSRIVAIIGMCLTIFEIGFLSISATPNKALSVYWDVFLGIVVLLLLLLSMMEKIPFIPYQWWMVLILGFILYGWVGIVGGTLVLISFILMLLEK
jgi:hypothetical protein